MYTQSIDATVFCFKQLVFSITHRYTTENIKLLKQLFLLCVENINNTFYRKIYYHLVNVKIFLNLQYLTLTYNNINS